MGAEPKVISYRSPWQNGVAEQWILSVRTELLKEYVAYYNYDRCHLSLDRNTPMGRNAQKKPSESAQVISLSKLGGLQHKYEWQKVA